MTIIQVCGAFFRRRYNDIKVNSSRITVDPGKTYAARVALFDSKDGLEAELSCYATGDDRDLEMGTVWNACLCRWDANNREKGEKEYRKIVDAINEERYSIHIEPSGEIVSFRYWSSDEKPGVE
ncbi:hypothetical protein J4231_00185 [Candidatus Woesearchaeota archaeon]|nr:hypothetical protein [Candidatus Woesearchaeota archaeon]